MVEFLKKASSITKKVFIVIAVYVIVINLFAHFLSKDKPKNLENPIVKNRQEIFKVIKDPKFNTTKRDKVIVGIYRASMCGLIGEACTDKPNDGDKNFDKSLFGGVAKLIAMPYANPPASGLYWVYSGLQNTGFIPKSYAAGIGFAALAPFQELWKVFRDISYTILVLVLIIIGFLIMFRVKINPQTIVSIENSLPRIVVSLLLITFSFAIAGFLIDLMYVIIALSVSILANNSVFPIDQATQTQLLIGTPSNLFGKIFWNKDILGIGSALFSIMPNFISVTVRLAVMGITVALLYRIEPLKQLIKGDVGDGPPAGGLIRYLIALGVFSAVGIILASAAPFILSVFILVTTGLLVFFRIFFLLLVAYIRIIVMIIFAPFIILANAFPGINTFSKWIKSLVADLLAFPIVIVMIILSSIIIHTSSNQTPLWQPPFLFNQVGSTFNVLIGIGILFMIPDVVKSIKQLFGIKESPFRFGIGTFFSGAAAGFAGGSSLLQKVSTSTLALPGLRTKFKGLPGIGKLISPPEEGLSKRERDMVRELAKHAFSQGEEEGP